MSFRPPWKHQEDQRNQWMRQGGFKNNRFQRRGPHPSNDNRDQDRRSPWMTSPVRPNLYQNQEYNRIPSLLDLPAQPAPPSPSIWDQPPPVFETANAPANKQFNSSEARIAPTPVPPPVLQPPPAMPLSLLLETEMWAMNGESRGDVKEPISQLPVFRQNNQECIVRKEEPPEEESHDQNFIDRKPDTEFLLDSLNKYNEEFQMSRQQIGGASNTVENVQAVNPQNDPKNVDTMTQKLLNRVANMDKHNIKQVINDPEPKFESALKKRASQLLRANVREKLRHFSIEEGAEVSENDQRGIEADMVVDSDKVPEVMYNMLGIEPPGPGESIDNSLENSIEPENMFINFEGENSSDELIIDTSSYTDNANNHDTDTLTVTNSVGENLQTIKENVPLNRMNRGESTEILVDPNTSDSVMNTEVDTSALSPLMAQNEDDNNITAFADNGIAIPQPSEVAEVKKDKVPPSCVPLPNANEPLSKELQNYKIPRKRQPYSDRYSRHDDRRRDDRRGGSRRDDRRHSSDRSYRRDDSSRRSESRNSRDGSMSGERNRKDPPRVPPEPSRRPPENKNPIKPNLDIGRKPPEDNRKRTNSEQAENSMMKRKKIERRSDNPAQRSWLSPGEKKCLSLDEQPHILFGPKYKNKCIQAMIPPASPTKSVAERELKIFHEMKTIDTSLMEIQQKKIEIDDQIQKLQTERMNIEMQSMKLQNQRFDLLNRILSIPVANADALVESDFEITPVKKRERIVCPERHQENNTMHQEVSRENNSHDPPASSSRGTVSSAQNSVEAIKTPVQNSSKFAEVAKKKKKPQKPPGKPLPKATETKEQPAKQTPASKEKKPPNKIPKIKLLNQKKKSLVPPSSSSQILAESTSRPSSSVESAPKSVKSKPSPSPQPDLTKCMKGPYVSVMRWTSEMIDEVIGRPSSRLSEIVVKSETKDEIPSDFDEDIHEVVVDMTEECIPQNNPPYPNVEDPLSVTWNKSSLSDIKSQVIQMKVFEGCMFAVAENDGNLYKISMEDDKRSTMILQLHEKFISSFLCHDTGLIFTIGEDGFVRKVNAQTFTGCLEEFHCSEPLDLITNSSWGQIFVVQRDHKIVVFDVKDLNQNKELKCENTSKIIGLVASEVDGKKVISIASQANEFSIRNAETGELIRRFHLERTIDYFTGHNHVILCGIDGKDFVHYRIMTGEEIARYSIGQKVLRIIHFPDMVYILCSNGRIYIWSSVENQLIGIVKGPEGVIKDLDVTNQKIFTVNSENEIWSCEKSYLPDKIQKA